MYTVFLKWTPDIVETEAIFSAYTSFTIYNATCVQRFLFVPHSKINILYNSCSDRGLFSHSIVISLLCPESSDSTDIWVILPHVLYNVFSCAIVEWDIFVLTMKQLGFLFVFFLSKYILIFLYCFLSMWYSCTKLLQYYAYLTSIVDTDCLVFHH